MLHFVQEWKLWLEKKLTIVPVKPASRMVTPFVWMKLSTHRLLLVYRLWWHGGPVCLGRQDHQADLHQEGKTVMWDKWHRYKSTLSALLWCGVRPHPAGVRHSHGSAACHSGHCWSLLILVTTLLAKFLFFLPLWLKPDLNPFHFVSTAHLWGFLFRLILACTWHLSKWKHITLQCHLFLFLYQVLSHQFPLFFGSLMFFATYIALSCCGELR